LRKSSPKAYTLENALCVCSSEKKAFLLLLVHIKNCMI
jgi:hypothetical protein